MKLTLVLSVAMLLVGLAIAAPSKPKNAGNPAPVQPNAGKSKSAPVKPASVKATQAQATQVKASPIKATPVKVVPAKTVTATKGRAQKQAQVLTGPAVPLAPAATGNGQFGPAQMGALPLGAIPTSAVGGVYPGYGSNGAGQQWRGDNDNDNENDNDGDDGPYNGGSGFNGSPWG